MRVVLGSALITSVNGADMLQALGLAVEPFSAGDADTAALLWPPEAKSWLVAAIKP